MTRASSLAVAFGAALALGACAGEGGQLATSPEAPAFQAAGVGPACNLTDLRKATSALFGNRDPANDIAKKFTSKNQNTPAATTFAYQLFGAIETKRGSSWAGSDAAKGAELTLQVIACSLVDYTDENLEGTNTDNARAAFTAALDAGPGTYAVVSGSETSITSKNAAAGLGAPVGGFGLWLGGQTLIIGYSIAPVNFTSEDDAGVFYEWSMVRPAGSGALNGLATISYCVGNGFDDDALRVQHLPSGNGGTILPVPAQTATIPIALCDPLASLQPDAAESFASRMLEGLLDVIRPDPLFAGTLLKGPVSGTLGDFSPTAVVDPGNTEMSFAVQPTGGTTNTSLPLQVLVTGAGGTPWEGVEVAITAAENNGTTLDPCGTTAVTNGDGLAIFPNFQINKPGVVHLTAHTVSTDDDLETYPADSVVSADFVVTGAGNEACQE